jgi:hypothetical protein
LFSVLFYFLGIGFTSIVSKIFRRQFIEKAFSNSSWKKVDKQTTLTKQY